MLGDFCLFIGLIKGRLKLLPKCRLPVAVVAGHRETSAVADRYQPNISSAGLDPFNFCGRRVFAGELPFHAQNPRYGQRMPGESYDRPDERPAVMDGRIEIISKLDGLARKRLHGFGNFGGDLMRPGGGFVHDLHQTLLWGHT